MEIIGAILKLIKEIIFYLNKINFLKKLSNLIFRPHKLHFDLKQQIVVFRDKDNKDSHYNYFCLLISNKSNKVYYINPENIMLNNERYIVFIQTENNFVLLYADSPRAWEDCENDIYKIYKENWHKIMQGHFKIALKPYETKIFPMKLVSANSHIFTSIKRNSLLFKAKSKISITLEINMKKYEYGLDRTYCYERYINYLAFYHTTQLDGPAIRAKRVTQTNKGRVVIPNDVYQDLLNSEKDLRKIKKEQASEKIVTLKEKVKRITEKK